MMGRNTLGILAALSIGVVSCTLVVGDEPAQCKRDADCARFAGARCAADGLCKQVAASTGGAAGSAGVSCSDNQDCLALVGERSFCKRSSATCVDLSDTVCGTVYGLLSNPRAIVVGALVPGTFGANQAQGKAIEKAIESAVDGFNSGLDADARPLAVVVCDESATGAVNILLDDLAVPVLFADPVESLVAQAQQHNTAIISPFYRPNVSFELALALAPPVEREGIAMAELISDDLILVLENAGVVSPKIALIADPNSPFHTALRSDVITRLGALSNVSVVSIDASAQSSASSVAQSTVESAAHIIVVLGEPRLSEIISVIETDWLATPRPLYLLSDRMETPLLYGAALPSLASEDPTLRARLLGVSIGASMARPIAQDFVSRIEPNDPHTSGANAFYDASYLIGYAAAAQHDLSTITGDDLVAGLSRLAGGTTTVAVGPSGRAAALNVLLGTSSTGVSLEGVTGTLSFTNRAITSDLQVWCVSKSGTKTAFVESGRTLAAGATSLSGAFSTACQPAL